MKFVSTRGDKKEWTFSEALEQGLAPDGGLFVPQALPQISWKDLNQDEMATCLVNAFVGAEDPLKNKVDSIIERAINFPLPVTQVSDKLSLLELYHGPTAAFKDVGARFLAQAYGALGREQTILVATSGDTGGAVASACDEVKSLRVLILFPENGVSQRQRKQLTCWGKNITSLAVKGSFDDCQKLVKETFAQYAKKLTSANSINIGRLVPQMIYYAKSAKAYFEEHGVAPHFIIPSGNMGNALACLMVRAMGLPVGRLTLSCNANRPVVDYFSSGKFTPRPSVKTLANAMDVGNPSNWERVAWFVEHSGSFLDDVEAFSIEDEEIKHTIKNVWAAQQRMICPHTATAFASWERLHKPAHAIAVATAHPAKFDDIINPLIGQKVTLPDSLQKIDDLQENYEVIDASLEKLFAILQQ